MARAAFYGDCMLRRMRAGALVAALALSGCATEPAGPVTLSPVPVGTPTPVFASKAEAAEAAKDAYERYLKAVGEVANDGGEDAGRLRPFLTPAAFEEEARAVQQGRQAGLRTRGTAKLRALKLQRANLSSGALTAYACVDLSGVTVLDESGDDVTPKDRVDQQTGLATFTFESGRLLLARNGTWSGVSIC